MSVTLSALTSHLPLSVVCFIFSVILTGCSRAPEFSFHLLLAVTTLLSDAAFKFGLLAARLIHKIYNYCHQADGGYFVIVRQTCLQTLGMMLLIAAAIFLMESVVIVLS